MSSILWEEIMITITSGEWIADLGALLCRNINNGIVVSFEKQGIGYSGKIQNMPIELMEQWAAIPTGHELIQKAVMDTEEVFMRAYFESDIEKNGIRDNLLGRINSV